MKRTSIEKLTGTRNVLRRFRALDSDAPSQVLEAFLIVCLSEGITVGEVGQKLGCSKASASRVIQALSKWNRFGKAGMDLVEATEDMADRRTKTVKLTNKGHALRDELADLM